MLDVVTKAAREVGGIVKLADLLGIKHPSFYSWDRVPAERALQIAMFAKVPLHDVRPDIYPAPATRETRVDAA
jgi:DNA-binding transcriptional regulator YdaS (Cro superfamily)